MRGARLDTKEQKDAVRIIPADAGSTMGRHTAECKAQDHPRGCGEHNSSLKILEYIPGSSPRMRGALVASG